MMVATPRLLESVPERVPSEDIVRSATLSSSPSGVVYFRVHFPERSPLGGSFGRSGSRYSNFLPSTKVNLIFVFSAKRSPSVIRRLAIFPFSMEPVRSATPKISAGEIVSARIAASAGRPASTDFFTALTISAGEVIPSELKANFTPALARAAGDDGARSRMRSSRRLGTSSGSASFSGSGHFRLTRTGSFLAASSGATS